MASPGSRDRDLTIAASRPAENRRVQSPDDVASPTHMAEVEGALRSSVRDELRHIGFMPAASKLYQPSPGLVPRTSLLERVKARGGDVVT